MLKLDENLTKEEIRNFSLPKLLSTIFRFHNMYLHDELNETKVNFGEFPFIITLYYKDHISQKNLADEFNISEGSVARAMRKLEDKNLIKRAENPDNRREKIITLTDEGRSITGKILDLDNIWEKEMFKQLSESEIINLKTQLIQIQNNSIKLFENIDSIN